MKKQYFLLQNMPTKNTLVLLIAILVSCFTVAEDFSASVDRKTLSKNDTLGLVLRYNKQTSATPDLSPLKDNFDILSQNQQSSFSMTNGGVRSYTEWQISLLPKTTGQLLIPPLTLNGVNTQPITVTITKAAKAPKGTEPVFIETELSNTKAYVQQQVLLKLRLFTAVPLRNVDISDLNIKGATVLKISEEKFQRQVKGKDYEGIELGFALFPESSGTLTVPSVRFSAVIPDKRDPFAGSLFSRRRGKQAILHSDEKNLTIAAKPKGATDPWLPAQGFSLSEKWSKPLDELVAGEPVTRTITLMAQGLSDHQLPPIQTEAGTSHKVYPDQPTLENRADSNGVIGSRVDSAAIVPTQAGEIELPPITVTWWDTSNRVFKQATLKRQTLTVKPAAANSISNQAGNQGLQNSNGVSEHQANTQEPTLQTGGNATETNMTDTHTSAVKDTGSKLLTNLSLILNLLLAGLVGWLLITRKSGGYSQSSPFGANGNAENGQNKEKAEYKKLQALSQQSQYAAFQQQLLRWGNTLVAGCSKGSPHHQPATNLSTLLNTLEARSTGTSAINFEELRRHCKELDQSLYSQTGNHHDDETHLQGKQAMILNLIQPLRKQLLEPQNNEQSLRPLYGN